MSKELTPPEAAGLKRLSELIEETKNRISPSITRWQINNILRLKDMTADKLRKRYHIPKKTLDNAKHFHFYHNEKWIKIPIEYGMKMAAMFVLRYQEHKELIARFEKEQKAILKERQKRKNSWWAKYHARQKRIRLGLKKYQARSEANLVLLQKREIRATHKKQLRLLASIMTWPDEI